MVTFHYGRGTFLEEDGGLHLGSTHRQPRRMQRVTPNLRREEIERLRVQRDQDLRRHRHSLKYDEIVDAEIQREARKAR